MCCGNKALTVFAYHVLTDVSGARDVNNIRCSQMRLLPLLLMVGIRNWLNLFLQHCTVEAIWEDSAGFHTQAPLCFSLLNSSYSILICSDLLSISVLSPSLCFSLFSALLLPDISHSFTYIVILPATIFPLSMSVSLRLPS